MTLVVPYKTMMCDCSSKNRSKNNFLKAITNSNKSSLNNITDVLTPGVLVIPWPFRIYLSEVGSDLNVGSEKVNE